MTRRVSLFAYAALLVGVIAFASSFARPTSGQPGATTPLTNGRYLPTAAPAAPGSPARLYVTDSQTGHSWLYLDNNQWIDLGNPTKSK